LTVELKNSILSLVTAIHRFVEKLNDTHLNSFQADWPLTQGRLRPVCPHSLPVLAWMPAATRASDRQTAAIVNMLASLANQLTWGQTYSAEDFGVGFLEKYGWTEFIGERGPIASSHMACGVLFLGPEVEYPRHSHDAEEVYVPLTGPSLWQRGNQDWVYRSAGRPIYHASRQPHAMRTKAAPLLALYFWHGGNLVQKSRIE
jgi:hypothetical protein